MTQSSIQANSTAVLSRSALRIVLFGMPDAGKSSLLGALCQAAQTQEHTLNGRLTDLSQGLAELQRRLYEERPRETLQEVVPYPIHFQPFAQAAAGPEEILLVDCDGRVANDLLARRRSLDAAGPDGSLTSAVLQAEALILVVDASAPPVQVDADFAEFARFLRLLEQSRGRQSAVGGLPVFLVLTKCDLLAQPSDTPAQWMERIEERKRQTGRRFQDFLARQEADGPRPFGQIDLHLWATAVKRPALSGSPARPRDPYGVAELFRQCFDSARGYRARCRHSSRRLVWTVAGAGSAVAAMLALAGGFVAMREPLQAPALANKVEMYRSNEGPTPSVRLTEPLQRKISQLTELSNDPEFKQLPPKQQEYVQTRLQELQDYRAYLERLKQSPAPATARNEEELKEIEARLESELALPAAYRKEWSQTDAALLWSERTDDVKAMRTGVAQLEEWFRDLKKRAQDLRQFGDRSAPEAPLSWNAWQGQVEKLIAEAESPPHRPTDKVAGSRTVDYRTVARFDRLARARLEWEEEKQRLEQVSDLSAALGLGGSSKPPVLRITAPGFAIEQAAAKLQELERAYPKYRDWSLRDLPDPVARELRLAISTSYQTVIQAGQEVVLKQLQRLSPDARETPDRWREVRDWLVTTAELREWRPLATSLARLMDPKAEDPVTALVSFLGKDQFDLEMRTLALAIPDDWKVRPVGKLAINQHHGEDAKSTLNYRILGEGRRDARRRLTTYTFVPEAGSTLTYRPGATLWAELGLNGDALFTWSGCRSLVYQFERLQRVPRLRRPGEDTTQAVLAEGVTLTITPEKGVPRVPDLMPVVKLEKR